MLVNRLSWNKPIHEIFVEKISGLALPPFDLGFLKLWLLIVDVRCLLIHAGFLPYALLFVVVGNEEDLRDCSGAERGPNIAYRNTQVGR
jgi:hypothetical protein